MRIKELHIENFKRFTNLTISGIPADARLVLLIGVNGSGKSSVFDALEVLAASNRSGAIPKDNVPVNVSGIITNFAYYYKGEFDLRYAYPSSKIQLTGANNEFFDIGIEFPGVRLTAKRNIPPNAFYGRSAIRYLPRLTRTSIGKTINIEEDGDRPKYYIDEDKRFENDIDLLIKDVVEKVFKGINENSKGQIDEIKIFLNKINDAIPRIFGDDQSTALTFKSFSPPADGIPSRLVFQKGNSEINYDLLSAGEKEVINLLFNLFTRSKYYDNTIYFFDEIDAHLNTKLQYNLLKEITENWLPENCQLWTASHSLGFIDYAKDYEQGVIIDFDNLDFDEPQVLMPAPKNFSVYDISIPKEMMDKLYDQGKRIVVCENKNDELLNKITGLNDIYFSGVPDSGSVFVRVKADARLVGLRDRDFLTSGEIIQLHNKYPNYRVTDFYCFENYLYHPDNITELQLPGFNKIDYINSIIKQKKSVQDIIIPNLNSARNGYAEFRLKAIPQEKNLSEIINALQSDSFDEFYPFFSMKDYYQKNYIGQFNIKKEELVKTNWFKNQIEKTLQ